MRNLKKILALVLSLMMVLSVMVTASAADFSDADEIQYAEAVDVLNGLGILTGAQGKFAPNGTLTRAQAAKIITFIALGEDTEKLVKGTGSAQFSDVTSGWAYDYISYCANEGIISGYQGKFFPDAEVTGYQFGKMVLNVLGIEGTYTGSGWELRVATALKSEDLLAGLADSFSLKANLTREEAAQIAFNAMTYVTETVYGYRIYKVVDGKNVYAPDFYSTLAEAAVAASALNTAGAGTYAVDTTKVAVNNTLGYKGYGLAVADEEVNGIGGHFWYVYDDSYAITDLFADDTVLSETTDGTSIAKLTSPKGTAAYDANKFVARLSAGATYYINGQEVKVYAKGTQYYKGDIITDGTNVRTAKKDFKPTADTLTAVIDENATTAETIASLIGKGVTVKLVNAAGTNAVYAEKVLIETPTFDTVTKIKAVAETKTEGAHVEYTFQNSGKLVVYTSVVKAADVSTVEVYDGIAVGDNVIVTSLADTIATVVKAGTVTGKVTATSTADDSITVNGTKYYKSDIDNVVIGSVSVSTNEVTFALDANGYIVKALDAAADPYVYAVTTKTVKVLVDGEIKDKVVVGAMFSDGSYTNITVAKVGTADATTDNTKAGLYTYKVNNDGEYVLTSVSAGKLAKDTDALKTNSTTLVSTGSKVYANGATKYVYANVDTNGKLVGTTVYTGYANYLKVATANGAYLCVKDTEGNDTNVASVVFVVPGTTVSSVVNYAWYLGTSSTELVDGKAVTSYDVVIDGVKTTLVEGKDVATGAFDSIAANKLVSVDSNGTVSVVSTFSGNGTLTYNGGLLFAPEATESADQVLAVDSDVPVYVLVEKTGAYATVEASDLTADFTGSAALSGNYILVKADTSAQPVVAIYVVVK